jgi:hypothetical protein
MAQAMDFATTLVPKLTKAEFLSSVRQGDALYCWGRERISQIIENISGGPSHVLTAWQPWPGAPWLTLEATFPDLSREGDSGVHCGLLSDYLNGYDGNLVLTRRPAVSALQVEIEIEEGLKELGLSYNWTTEVSIAARKVLPFLPPIESNKTLYCSGLRQKMCLLTLPYNIHGPDPATPEQVYVDPSTLSVAIQMLGTN